MTTPVSFEIAKLLKEKGFDMPCNNYYTSRGLLNSDGWGDIIYEDGGFSSGEPERMIRFDYSDFSKRQKEEYYLCPTISEVVMWLYEKHGIWIGVQPISVVGKFQFRTYYNNKGVMNQHWNESMSKEFNSPTEAYEDAIEYTLKNLI